MNNKKQRERKDKIKRVMVWHEDKSNKQESAYHASIYHG